MSQDSKVGQWNLTHEMTFPSNNVAEVKRVSLMDLIVNGGIPSQLSTLATELATAENMKLTSEQLKEYEEVVNLVTKAAFVKPAVTDTGGGDSVAVRDIEWVDRVQLFNWGNGVTTLLRPFRPEGKKKRFTAS